MAARVALSVLCLAAAASARDKRADKEWLSSEMPLPLAVRTPQDLAFKGVAERQYLIFNLLASGKLAWDAGDFAAAAGKWEALLAVPGLDPEVDKVVRPLAESARKQAGGAPDKLLSPARAGPFAPERAEEKRPPPAPLATVQGTVSGGGASGPGGAVVQLRRTDGPMPRTSASKDKIVVQRGKAFVPRVLAVPVGTSVAFRNEDQINHNVFSLSPAAPHLDTGLYGQGGEKTERFDKPGVVQLLCNIHSSMIGYLVVVDSPYFAQADASGAFAIKNVVPGEYEVETWHENASQATRQKLTVSRDGAKVALTVGGDRQPPAFPPDKYGKARQVQLGY